MAAGVPIVCEDGNGLTLEFEPGTVQSRMSREDPGCLQLAYTRLMMGFLLFHPQPARIVMIGLGGGSLAKYCREKLPEADFTAVEISPEVIALRDVFAIPPDGPRFRIVCQNGADFVRAGGEPLDVLIVDAFDQAGHPEDLSSAAFYDYCEQRLAPDGGVLVVNLHADDPSYDLRVRRIRDAFAGRIVVVEVGGTENDLVFAGTVRPFPPSFETLVDRLRTLQGAHPIGLDGALKEIVQFSHARHATLRRRRVGVTPGASRQAR